MNRLQYFLSGVAIVLLILLFQHLGMYEINSEDFQSADLFLIPLAFILNFYRIKNIGYSGWYSLLGLLPLINLVLFVFMISYPPGYSEYKRLDGIGKVLAVISGIFFIVLPILAVAFLFLS